MYGAVAIAVFAIVLIAVVVIVFRFRAREEGPEPSRVNDAPRLEGFYVLGLALIAAFLVTFTFIKENQSDAALAPHRGLVVQVAAAKWHWSFFYPAYGISELGTDASPPTLYVPQGTNINFRLVSVDVIHAFWIPTADFKRAAYPDFTEYFTLSFDKPGFTPRGGVCAEFCGLLHAEMRFNLDVMRPGQFAQFVATHRAPA